MKTSLKPLKYQKDYVIKKLAEPKKCVSCGLPVERIIDFRDNIGTSIKEWREFFKDNEWGIYDTNDIRGHLEGFLVYHGKCFWNRKQFNSKT